MKYNLYKMTSVYVLPSAILVDRLRFVPMQEQCVVLFYIVLSYFIKRGSTRFCTKSQLLVLIILTSMTV
jgi:hypothetical protein